MGDIICKSITVHDGQIKIKDENNAERLAIETDRIRIFDKSGVPRVSLVEAGLVIGDQLKQSGIQIFHNPETNKSWIAIQHGNSTKDSKSLIGMHKNQPAITTLDRNGKVNGHLHNHQE